MCTWKSPTTVSKNATAFDLVNKYAQSKVVVDILQRQWDCRMAGNWDSRCYNRFRA